jgi:predicted dehydrogenase
MKTSFILVMITILSVIIASCGGGKSKKSEEVKPKSAFTGAKGEVKLITLDPGHFHAALVQKNMYDQISPEVYVYAPEGFDLREHLKRIEGYNSRPEKPTSWIEKVYTGADYFEKMLADKPGNVVVLAGNNRIKTDYIKKSVEAGLNVLSDKPMVIVPEKFAELEEAFKIAKDKGVLLSDIMTERYEITTTLQRELSMLPEIFGKLQPGTSEKPAVEKISVHHFYKDVSGSILVRPAWYFDVDQQGEGIVDVTTHLADLIQWECFPNQAIQKTDIEMLTAKHWPTILTKDEFKSVTQLDQFPDFLNKDVKDGKLNVFANGEMTYKIKGAYAKVSVEWHYKAPEGGGDTHYSIMRGSNCDLLIKQGKEEKYDPTLYVIVKEGTDLGLFAGNLEKAVVQDLPQTGLKLEKFNQNTWKVIVPASYKVGHEAHFAQVTNKYLEYLKQGKVPDVEVQNMITKYYTTTSALKLARETK